MSMRVNRQINEGENDSVSCIDQTLMCHDDARFRYKVSGAECMKMWVCSHYENVIAHERYGVYKSLSAQLRIRKVWTTSAMYLSFSISKTANKQ